MEYSMVYTAFDKSLADEIWAYVSPAPYLSRLVSKHQDGDDKCSVWGFTFGLHEPVGDIMVAMAIFIYSLFQNQTLQLDFTASCECQMDMLWNGHMRGSAPCFKWLIKSTSEIFPAAL